MRLRRLASDVWVLTKGYWGSEERWSARLVLTREEGDHARLFAAGMSVLGHDRGAAGRESRQIGSPLPSPDRVSEFGTATDSPGNENSA
jgi:hypothetical protein